MIRSVRFAIAASALAAAVASVPSKAQSADQAYPFGWDAALWGGPRPSPLPVNYKGPKDFHREVVSLLNGGLAMHFIDVLLPDGALPVTLQRRYRSGLLELGAFGLGWSSNLDVRVLIAKDRTPVLVDSDGQVFGTEPVYAVKEIRPLKDRAELIYDKASGPIGFQVVGGAFPQWSIEREGDGWKRILMPGVIQRFDSAGRMIEQRLGERDMLRLTYADAAARYPSEITDLSGRTVKLTYRDGLVVQADFPPNRSVRYVYNDRYLTEVIDPIGRKTTFTYANAGLSRMVLPDGAAFAFQYAGNGNLREVSGPGALRTEFAWQADSQRGGYRLVTTSSFGAAETVEVTPTAISLREFNKSLPDRQALALQFRRTKGGREQGTATLLPRELQGFHGSVVVKTPDTQVLLKHTGYAADTDRRTSFDDIDGLRTRFTPALAPRRDSKLTYDSAGRAIAIALDSETREAWKWDDADRIIEWSDADGNITYYDYDAANRVGKIARDQANLVAEYNQHGLLTRLSGANGDETRYRYDDQGRLMGIESTGQLLQFSRDRNGRTDELRVNGKLRARYAYDSAGQLTTVTEDDSTTRYVYDQRGDLSEEIDHEGRKTSYQYDTQRRLIFASYPDGRGIRLTYLPDGHSVAVTDAGGTTTREYDEEGKLRMLQLPGMPAFKYSYDELGRLRSIVGADGNARRLSYDAEGHLVSDANTKDGGIRYSYDSEGRLRGYESAGENAAFRYSDNGEVTVDTTRAEGKFRLRQNAAGRLIDQADSAGAVRKYEYDGARLRVINGPAGDRLRYDYDWAGRIAALHHEMDGRTVSKTYVYDERGQLSEIAHEDGAREQFKYNPEGGLASKRDRLGNVYSYQYAANGRIESIAGPFGVERWKFDPAGRMVEHSDPTEGTFKFEYSDAGNQVAVVNQAGARTRVSIDANGQPTLTEDALGGTIRSEYDSLGRLIAYTDPNGGTTTWSYNAQGRVSERRTPLGKTYAYTYDPAGRLTETRLPGNAIVKRDYDALGRLAKLSTSDGQVWGYAYDQQNRVASIDGSSGRETYRYDALGRVTEYLSPSGVSVRIGYDSAGRTQSIETSTGARIAYSYNPAGLLNSVTTAAGELRYSYDAAGRIIAIDYPNKTRTIYRYSAGARIQSITSTDGRGKLVLGETYEYDVRGNVTAIARRSDTLAAAGSANVAANRLLGHSAFEYDDLNRVVRAAFPDGSSERFAYDRSGNVVTHKRTAAGQEVDIQYQYDADQVLTKVNGGAVPLHPFGSLCAEQAGERCTVEYDALGRLRSWRDQRYDYDHDGQLLGWRDGRRASVRLLRVGDHVLGEQDEAGALRLYVPGVSGSIWSVFQVGARDYFPIRSANGTLLALTDGQGNVVKTCAYHTFSPAAAWSQSDVSVGCEFAGGRQLGPGVWFGGRVLSEVGARFMTRDPSGPDKDGNPYSYAFANPLRFVDLIGASGRSLSGGLPDGRTVPFVPKAITDQGITRSVAKPWDGTEQSAVGRLREIALTDPNPVVRKNAADGLTQYSQAHVEVERVAVVNGQEFAGRTGRSSGRDVTIYQEGVKTGTKNFGGDATQNAASTLRHELEHTTQSTTTYTQADEWAARQKDYFIKTAGGEQYSNPLIGVRPDDPSRLRDIETLNSYRDLPAGAPTPDPYYVDQQGIRRANQLSPIQQHAAEELGRDIHRGREITSVGQETTITKGGHSTVDSKGGLTVTSPDGSVQVQNPLTGEMNTPKQLDSGKRLNVSSQTERLKEMRQAALERAGVQAERAPISTTSEVLRGEGNVARAVSRELSAAERALQEARAIGSRIARAVESAGEKAASKLAGLYDAVGGGVGRIASKAAKVLSRLADTSAGRFARVVVPAVGEVLGAIGWIETAHWLGQTIGETAADLYLGVKKKFDKVLDALDKLARDIAAKDTPQVKKKRLAELVNRGSAQPQNIGYAPLHDAPPGGLVASQPPGGSAATPSGSAPGAQPSPSADGFPRPDRPLGGSAANQPPRQQQSPDQAPPQTPPQQGQNDPFPAPTTPLGGSLNQSRNNSQGARPPAPPPRADLSGMCGSDFRQSMQRMMAGQLSGLQATECWCYFWDKGGRNNFAMFNGRPAADLCAKPPTAWVPPATPTPPAPRPPAPPPPAQPVSTKPATPPKPKETDWCEELGKPPCPGLSLEQAREMIRDAEFKKHLREELEKKRREMGPKAYEEWANSPPSPEKPWQPPTPSSKPPITGKIEPGPAASIQPGSGGGPGSLGGLLGALGGSYYAGAAALGEISRNIK